MEMYYMGKCALCDNEKELQLSHIIPKFVGRHLKGTSIGNIRNSENPNKVVQDLEKYYMLCHDCEELFSAAERWFANNIFYPRIKNGEVDFNYNEYLYYFISSLSWRSLYLDIMNFVSGDEITIVALESLIKAERILKAYLKRERTDIGNIEHHIFFFDRIKDVGGQRADEFLRQPHVTIHRSVTSYTNCCGDTYFTISNLMGIIVVTFYHKSEKEEWIGTGIEDGVGNVRAENQGMRSVVGNEFSHWMNLAEEQMNNMNETQKEKIVQKIKAVGEDIKNYDIYKDIQDDVEIMRTSK